MCSLSRDGASQASGCLRQVKYGLGKRISNMTGSDQQFLEIFCCQASTLIYARLTVRGINLVVIHLHST